MQMETAGRVVEGPTLPEELDQTADGFPEELTTQSRGKDQIQLRNWQYALSLVPVTSRVAGLHIFAKS